MTAASRAYYLARARARRHATAMLIAENPQRFAELMNWTAADTAEITKHRREVLFRETAPRRTA